MVAPDCYGCRASVPRYCASCVQQAITERRERLKEIEGDKYRLELDTGKGTLVAYKNGTRLSGHITGLGGQTLHAFVDMETIGDKVRLVAEDSGA